MTDDVNVLWGIDMAVNALLIIDILVNFNTAYFDFNNKLIANRGNIAVKYLKGWIILDLIAAAPYGLFTSYNY